MKTIAEIGLVIALTVFFMTGLMVACGNGA